MYTVKFTDKSKTPISIDEEQIDNSTAITLFGRKRLSYGKGLQENLLHILENFACPEDANAVGTPDVIKASSGVFDNPIEGQCWYNSTTQTLNYYNGTNWIPFAREDDIAANWGVIVDGQYLPKPVSEITGKVFDYPECAWIVSPFSFPQKLDYMECSTDDSALVSMKYRLSGTDDLIGGTANYLIVGISGNENAPQPTFIITPTPTPTPTSSVGQSPTPTPTVTRSVTPAVSVTPSVTPEQSVTPTPSVSSSKPYQAPVTPTPTPSPTRTPVASVTPTPSPIAVLKSNAPSASAVYGSCEALNTGTTCNAITGYVSVTPTGGVPPYTYSWTRTAGVGTPLSPTSQSTEFENGGTVPNPTVGSVSVTGTFVCTVKDSRGATSTSSPVTATFTYGNTS